MTTFQFVNTIISLLIAWACIMAFGNAAVANSPFQGDFTLQTYFAPGLLGYMVASWIVPYISSALVALFELVRQQRR